LRIGRCTVDVLLGVGFVRGSSSGNPPGLIITPDAVLASVARIGAITRDVLRRAAATGVTPLSIADGIVRGRIRQASEHLPKRVPVAGQHAPPSGAVHLAPTAA
jgi:hypothetical protein